MRVFVSLLGLLLLFNQATPRQQLIDLIFGGTLPSRLPDSIEPGITAPAWADTPNLARIDRLTVLMDYGLESVAYHFIPTVGNGQLMIYHEGHMPQGFVARKVFIQAAIERGFAVAALDMPLMGANSMPEVELGGRTWQLQFHGQMIYLQPAAGHPLRYFLEPVIVILNYLDDLGYSHISMAGISGGGWTTTWIAALDSRIQSSYPVAGSMPLWVRGLSDWGDWEQNELGIYSRVEYEDLYILGASNGRQLQILNRYDTCCFSGLRWQAYYEDVRARSGGQWNLWLDETIQAHDISPAARAVIFGELAAFGETRRVWLPVVEK